MIGYIIHGGSGSFGNLIDYANNPEKDAMVISCSKGVFTLNNKTMADSFEMQASMNTRLRTPMSHIILSFSARDSESLTDERMAHIAEDYLKQMNYLDTQFVIFRHHDKKHPHCHIVANRVNNKGKTIKDSNEKLRNVKICKYLTMKYNLYLPKGKESVNENRLKGKDAIRYFMMHCVKESLSDSLTWEQFLKKLKKAGILFRFRYNIKTHGIEGISFTLDHKAYRDGCKLKHDISFTGKKLDASLTLSNICRQLGNPYTIAHESARDLYERQKEDYQFRCSMEEFRHINETFPDFDSLFPELTQAAEQSFPAIEGNYGDKSTDSSSESDIVSVGLEMLGVLIMQPYQAHTSSGGGGTSNDMKWNDEDKKKKRSYWETKRKKSR